MLSLHDVVLLAVAAAWALGHVVLERRLEARTAAVEAREQLVAAREKAAAPTLEVDGYDGWDELVNLQAAVRDRDGDVCRCCGFVTSNSPDHPSRRVYMLLDEDLPTLANVVVVHRKCRPAHGELFVLLPAGATADQVARGEVTGTVMRRGGRI